MERDDVLRHRVPNRGRDPQGPFEDGQAGLQAGHLVLPPRGFQQQSLVGRGHLAAHLLRRIHSRHLERSLLPGEHFVDGGFALPRPLCGYARCGRPRRRPPLARRRGQAGRQVVRRSVSEVPYECGEAHGL
ncbi:MAG: hypothetical protein M0C28_17500 [Candidatus Moduliflexus flocculans]|nr:hypothetical protein [Candidatus Moduliflexus flocculans]